MDKAETEENSFFWFGKWGLSIRDYMKSADWQGWAGGFVGPGREHVHIRSKSISSRAVNSDDNSFVFF